MYVKEFVKKLQTTPKTLHSQQRISFFFSPTHTTGVDEVFTVNYHIWVIRTLLSHRKWWDRSTSYFLSSEQELKAWYKGFKRDCPRAQLTRQKVITLNSATSCSILSFDMKTDIKTRHQQRNKTDITKILQKHEMDPTRCNIQTNKRQTQP